jgi:hypothetical protein
MERGATWPVRARSSGRQPDDIVETCRVSDSSDRRLTRAERRDRQRRLSPRARSDLQDRLRDQLALLRIHGATFDSSPNNSVVSLSLATVIRTLVHETGSSHSLLDQLAMKGRMRFVDTALPIGSLAKAKMSPGLVSLQIASEGRGMRWIPLREDDSDAATRRSRLSAFEPWWRTPIHRDVHLNTWSRRGFVMYQANKEGGAHIDPGPRAVDFEALENENSMGWSINHSIHGEFQSGTPVPASIRQIAHELQLSIESEFPTI